MKTILLILPALWAFTITRPAAAAEPGSIDALLLKKFEARTYQDASGRVLRYRLFKPSGVSATHPVPLVLFLHGAAGAGEDNARQFNGGNQVPAQALIADDVQSRQPCYVLAPQCPRGDSWASGNAPPTQPAALTMALLATLPRDLPIDGRRIYLVGVSMGGRGAWELAVKFPGCFAAAVPICAAGDPQVIANASHLVTLPIWCFHGTADPLVPVASARRIIEALRKAGGTPRYTEYPGVGHDSYRNAFREPELLPWLFAQRRKG